jgi:hypothetical protein
VKPHSMLLRTGCMLPDGIETRTVLRKVDVCRRYDSLCSGRKIRNAGWHSFGFRMLISVSLLAGRQNQLLAKRSTLLSIKLKGRFNAAELDSINVRKYPGFQLLWETCTLHTTMNSSDSDCHNRDTSESRKPCHSRKYFVTKQ